MGVRKIYAGTLWWTDTERDLLDLKLAEGDEYVDRWIISQATTTYRGKPRAFNKPLDHPRIDWRLAHTENVRGKGNGRAVCRERNAVQRNELLAGLTLQPDDIFVFSDLDEITQRQDWPHIVDAVAAHDFVRIVMRRYYCKINLKCSQNWAMAYAVTGKWLAAHPQKTVDDIRDRMPKAARGRCIKTRGQHFSWLYADFATAKHKMSNHAHPENANPTVQQRIHAGEGPKGQETQVVPVDDSYPTFILMDTQRWQKYVAKAAT